MRARIDIISLFTVCVIIIQDEHVFDNYYMF